MWNIILYSDIDTIRVDCGGIENMSQKLWWLWCLGEQWSLFWNWQSLYVHGDIWYFKLISWRFWYTSLWQKRFPGWYYGEKRWTDEWIVLYEHLCPAVIYWKDKKDVFMLTGDREVDIVVRKNGEQMLIPGDYSFSSYEKLTFLTPWYLRVRIRG